MPDLGFRPDPGLDDFPPEHWGVEALGSRGAPVVGGPSRSLCFQAYNQRDVFSHCIACKQHSVGFKVLKFPSGEWEGFWKQLHLLQRRLNCVLQHTDLNLSCQPSRKKKWGYFACLRPIVIERLLFVHSFSFVYFDLAKIEFSKSYF